MRHLSFIAINFFCGKVLYANHFSKTRSIFHLRTTTNWTNPASPLQNNARRIITHFKVGKFWAGNERSVFIIISWLITSWRHVGLLRNIKGFVATRPILFKWTRVSELVFRKMSGATVAIIICAFVFGFAYTASIRM